MKRRDIILALLVGLQVLFLLGWAGYHESIRRHAPEILLETRPVDPRDILRGDYMILNYQISRHAAPVGWPKDGKTEAVVIFKPEGSFYVIDEIRQGEPDETDPRLWVWADVSIDPFGTNQLNLNYGIEEFFVPEGKGRPEFKTMEVLVSVSATHRLYIKELRLDGQAYP